MRLEKIKNKKAKEKKRGGTKYTKSAMSFIIKQPEIKKFINRIIVGDAEEVLTKMSSNAVDIVVTSPPYNFGHSYINDPTQDTKKWNEYFEKLFNIWKECYRVLKPGGRICVNIQPLFSDYNPTHHIISNQLMELGFLWKSEILWDKSNYNAKYTAWGSWCSPSMPYLKYTWEFIEVFSKKSHKKIGPTSNIDISPDEFKKWVNAKWNIVPETRMKKFHHPAMFPEELPRRLLKLFSYRNDIVLDPFNGVGTTTLVAAKLDRKFIGIDISEEYCKTAVNRIKGYFSQLNLFAKKDTDVELISSNLLI